MSAIQPTGITVAPVQQSNTKCVTYNFLPIVFVFIVLVIIMAINMIINIKVFNRVKKN